LACTAPRPGFTADGYQLGSVLDEQGGVDHSCDQL
jgi:hypothetical protein